MLRTDVPPAAAYVALPGLCAGDYRLVLFDTRLGQLTQVREVAHPGGDFRVDVPPVARDVAIAISHRRLHRSPPHSP